VSLVHSEEEASQAPALDGMVETLDMCRVPTITNYIRGGFRLATRSTLTHILLDSPEVHGALRRVLERQSPDVVLVYCSSMGRFALEPPLVGLPFVVDLIDVDSVKWHDLAVRNRPPMRWIYKREAHLLGRFEAELSRRALATTVVTRREENALSRIAPEARVVVSPLGIDTTQLRPSGPPEDTQDVIFCGVMNYPPNEDACVSMTNHIWPLVKAKRPQARLLFVGADPSKRVRSLANASTGVVVTGTVPDVRPYLWRSAVSVAPLLTARGTQSKVLEAVACGLPTVVTEVVAEGLPEAILPACTVAGTAEAFAAAIVSLLDASPAERRARAERVSFSSLSWEDALAPLIHELEQAARKA